MLDWVSGTPAELTLWGMSSSGMPSFRASSHVYTYHQPKKLLIPYMQLNNPSSFLKAKIDLLLSCSKIFNNFLLGQFLEVWERQGANLSICQCIGLSKKIAHKFIMVWYRFTCLKNESQAQERVMSITSSPIDVYCNWCMVHISMRLWRMPDFHIYLSKRPLVGFWWYQWSHKGSHAPAVLNIIKIRRNPNNLPAGQIFIFR